jgi:chromosome partitioning protein
MNDQQPTRRTPPTAASTYSVPVPSNDDSTPLAAAAQEHVSLLQRASSIQRFERPVHSRVFVVANQKGGVGKTTTTVNVAAALALKGLRVLVVDLDPQGNASTALNVPHSEGTPGVYEAIVEGVDLAELVTPCPDIPGLTVLPASIDLAGAEIELVSLVARESRLDRALQSYLADREAAGDRIDYVLIDCPPSLGLLTVNAMVAGREVLIPIQCEYYALEGLGQLIRNIDLIRAHLNPKLEITTILLTMFDGRTRLSAGVAEEVRSHFAEKVITTPIPRSVRISEAPSYQQSVITYDGTSSGALSYLEAAREIALAGSKGATR